MTAPARILLVEDEDLIAEVIRGLLEPSGFEMVVCTNADQAWRAVQDPNEPFHVILLDRGLPDMDGMDLLRRIKADPKLAHTPVILETGLDDTASIRQGLAEGAYYYLTKPLQPEVLLAVVNAALAQILEHEEMLDSVRRAERPLAFLRSGEFEFRTPDEGRLLANYLARACPQPERAIEGLQELLLNAVEHGNLAISYAEKGDLLRQGAWQTEVSRRLELAPYRDRHVNVQLRRESEALRITIRDQGNGFDWTRYLDFDPERAFDLHGRGIAMARKLSFDRLEYRGNGNTVVASILIETDSASMAPRRAAASGA